MAVEQKAKLPAPIRASLIFCGGSDLILRRRYRGKTNHDSLFSELKRRNAKNPAT